MPSEVFDSKAIYILKIFKSWLKSALLNFCHLNISPFRAGQATTTSDNTCSVHSSSMTAFHHPCSFPRLAKRKNALAVGVAASRRV
jgi:hypothetical protein